MISLVAFGRYEDGGVWQEHRYQYPNVLEAVNDGENVSRVEGFYVLETRYDPNFNLDKVTVIYEENTENYGLRVDPTIRVEPRIL